VAPDKLNFSVFGSAVAVKRVALFRVLQLANASPKKVTQFIKLYPKLVIAEISENFPSVTFVWRFFILQKYGIESMNMACPQILLHTIC
jgi:hypothetical protein